MEAKLHASASCYMPTLSSNRLAWRLNSVELANNL